MQLKQAETLDLSRLTVAKPCSAKWDTMTGDQKTRHCGDCGLNVYNISAMSVSDARDLIASHEGKRLCIRLHKRADGTVITSDCPRGLAAYRRRVGRIAAAAFASILGLFTAGYSQSSAVFDAGQGRRGLTTFSVPLIEGRVTDQTGARIPNAIVSIETESGKTIKKKSDGKGNFQFLDSRLSGRLRLSVESEGFATFVDFFTIRAGERVSYNVHLEVGSVIGDFFIIPAPQIDMRASDVTTVLRSD